MIEFRTLQPGLLVSMKTEVHGNVTYQVNDRDVQVVDRSEITDIHTRKTVADVEEQERAIKQRTKIRGLILTVCTKSESGLLCPNAREAELREAVVQAREMADKFNASARTTHIEFRVICGRIAQDDVETVRAITSEVRSLMEDMQRGVKALDVKTIRAAAAQLMEVGKILSPEAKRRVEVAVKAGRATATKMAKAGEVAANEIDRAAIRKIRKARTSFLDINTEVAELAEPKARGRNMDLAV
jgi:hypothetical protein